MEVVALHREGERDEEKERDGGMLDNKRRRAAWKCALMMLSKMSGPCPLETSKNNRILRCTTVQYVVYVFVRA